MTERPTGRRIATRIIIRGDLTLLSPAYLGNGDAEGITDMPLLRDAVDGRPLLTGSSIAGALRAYIQTRERGYHAIEQSDDLTTRLFGGHRGDDLGDQSALIVADARGRFSSYSDGSEPDHPVPTEIRDGVRIDVQQRIAEDKKKYDLELLPAGTVFPLTFELALPDNPAYATALRATLAAALHGLTMYKTDPGTIAIGARRSRGLGRCGVRDWNITTYDLTGRADLLAWLSQDYPVWGYAPVASQQGDATRLLDGHTADPIPDRRRAFTITASFLPESSILIRSTDPLSESNMQPDATPLRSRHLSQADPTPVIPGTSLAGVLRARAIRIVRTLIPPERQAVGDDLIAYLFGRDLHDEPATVQPTASRLMVEDVPLCDGHLLVQQRVAIDRFTGGAFHTALFSEAPVFGGTVNLRLRFLVSQSEDRHADRQADGQRQDAAFGLLLLLLKDLWTGDLPLGGTSSIGRGVLRGMKAAIYAPETDAPDGRRWTWTRVQNPETVSHQLHIEQGDPKQLERYVATLHQFLEHTP